MLNIKMGEATDIEPDDFGPSEDDNDLAEMDLPQENFNFLGNIPNFDSNLVDKTNNGDSYFKESRNFDDTNDNNKTDLSSANGVKVSKWSKYL